MLCSDFIGTLCNTCLQGWSCGVGGWWCSMGTPVSSPTSFPLTGVKSSPSGSNILPKQRIYLSQNWWMMRKECKFSRNVMHMIFTKKGLWQWTMCIGWVHDCLWMSKDLCMNFLSYIQDIAVYHNLFYILLWYTWAFFFLCEIKIRFLFWHVTYVL